MTTLHFVPDGSRLKLSISPPSSTLCHIPTSFTLSYSRTSMVKMSIHSTPSESAISINTIVLGCGMVALDFLVTVDSYPKPDDKIRSTSFQVQGGGNTGNAMTCAARLGLTPRIISKVADDSQGKRIRNELEADGIDTSFIVRSNADEVGKYVQSDVPRQLLYVPMVDVRQTIVADASTALSRAVCTATRYSAVRRQFGSQNGGQEIQDGIEECRKLCGGHGYLCGSGLPELFAVYVPACTYEGDNIVLLLQVARYLMKTVSQLGSRKKPVGTIAYMGKLEHLMQCRSDVEQAKDWLKPSVILEAFEARAARMSVACAQNISKFDNPEEGFAELAADLVEAALAHCQLIVVSKFIEKLQQDIPGKGVKQQLEALCGIYALFLLHKHQGDFLGTGYITSKQASLANEQLRALYSQLRPNAISLVDAFNYTDHFLGSILGRYDANVYPKLYEAAWKILSTNQMYPMASMNISGHYSSSNYCRLLDCEG